MMNMNEMDIKSKFLRGNRFKLSVAWIITITAVIFTIIFSFRVFGSSDAIRNGWVYDSGQILSNATIESINAKNDVLYKATGAEIVVVAEKDDSKNRNLVKRSEDLFKQHNLGDNGVLFIIAVPDNSNSGFGAAIGNFFGDLFGGARSSYAYQVGRDIPHTLDTMIERNFEADFMIAYNDGDFNAAVLSMFDNMYNYLGSSHGLNASDSHTANNTAYAGETSMSSSMNFSFISTISIIVLVIFMVMIFSRRRRTHSPHRIYRSPSWFGGRGYGYNGYGRGRRRGSSGLFGFGMGYGLGRMSGSRNNNRPRNNSGSFFNGSGSGGSSSRGGGGGNRSGGSGFGGFGSGSSGSRPGGGGSRGGSGGFRGGSSGSRGGGGGSRSGGSSRGGGGRRR
jgi:hypothetical protein